ncbi:MAG: phosphoribosylformylglycinamidine synthase subunit PurS [Elusimicrobia bacterium]|nr:phosphoribosylformylglycinamidine synthase subunit PurS [Elusimicrobiota bacterium]
MKYTIEVSLKPNFSDHHGEHVHHDILVMGFLKKVPRIKFHQLYNIEGSITEDEIKSIAEKLLTDPITEKYSIIPEGSEGKIRIKYRSIEVWLKYGVTDAVAGSVLKAVEDLGIKSELKIKTGQKYIFEGAILPRIAKQIAEKLLVNSMIQQYFVS